MIEFGLEALLDGRQVFLSTTHTLLGDACMSVPPASPTDPAHIAALGAHQQQQHTELHQAAVNGQEAAARALLAAGAAVDATDAEGRTPLLLAASRGHVDMVRVLLAAGAALEAQHNVCHIQTAAPTSSHVP